MSECLIACILRGTSNNTERCVRRCGRIMEGVAEVSKRKALLSAAVEELKTAQDKVKTDKSEHEKDNYSSSSSFENGKEELIGLLNPLLAKQEEEKERAQAVARAAFQTVKNTRRENKPSNRKSEL